MKKLSCLLLIGVAALLATTSTQAQGYAYATQTKLSNARFGTGTTNIASPIFIDVRKQSSVALSATIRGATTATNIYTFGWSVNGTTYSTNQSDCVTWVADSLSAISSVRTTNISTGGYGYLVLFNVTATLINTNSLEVPIKIL